MKKILVSLFIIVIIFSILGIGAYFGYQYYLETENNEFQDKFYSYVFQNNLKNIFDYSLEENIYNKLQDGKYNSKTKVDFSNTFSTDSNFEIDKLTLESDIKTDKNNKKNTLKFNYSNNELFSIDILSNPNYIAFKNSDVLNHYIGLKKDKTKTVLSKVNPTLKDFYKKIKDNELENFILQNNNSIFAKNNNNYIDSLKKYINSKLFIDEGTIFIEQNGEKTETNAYSLTLSKEEFLRIYSVLTQLIIDDENIRNSIISYEDYKNEIIESFESNLDFNEVVIEDQEEIYSLRVESNANNNVSTKEFSTDSISESIVLAKLETLAENANNKIDELKKFQMIYKGIKYLFATSTNFTMYTDEEDLQNDLDEIFENINNIINEKVDENSNIKIITYVSNNHTLKTSAFLGDNIEINVDYINQTDNKYITTITISEKIDDEYNGYTITLSKNKTTAIDNNTIEIGIIKNSKIISKLELKLNIEGTANSNKYKNNISFLYSGTGGKFSCNVSNDLSFVNNDVETINSDNTLLIDVLEDESFYYTINKLNSKIDSEYEDKVSKLNLINANISDTILQSNEQENVAEDENSEEKDYLIDILVEKISNEMGIAEQEGTDYTIQDLKDLEIEGYNIQVSVSEDIAIIKMNNYTFKIDKDFNLSE